MNTELTVGQLRLILATATDDATIPEACEFVLDPCRTNSAQTSHLQAASSPVPPTPERPARAGFFISGGGPTVRKLEAESVTTPTHPLRGRLPRS